MTVSLHLIHIPGTYVVDRSASSLSFKACVTEAGKRIVDEPMEERMLKGNDLHV